MDSLERQDLRELISQAGGPFVSIYQPTHRAGADIQQDPIRLKNLIREAAEKLKTAGNARADCEKNAETRLRPPE